MTEEKCIVTEEMRERARRMSPEEVRQLHEWHENWLKFKDASQATPNVVFREVSKKKVNILLAIGVASCILSFGLGFILWYDYFFEHEDWVHREDLLFYLRNCPPEAMVYANHLSWEIATSDGASINYWRNRDGVSYHPRGTHDCLCTFAAGLFAKHQRRKIKRAFETIALAQGIDIDAELKGAEA